ncbi:hypothetical protein [Phytoactinopolyspora mesophila]|uniref:Uncharacterized protein n=1 Tax=Phytoactinopolyspora mesophila TaxID=2650750 RepID=A0A7K3M966_9ACTN|nr:hypothetical protein [Phytoactinopolyspora mesophila]NDL59855.1 hypothetical protein [Phytoactinopolyspora mesophila]
MAESTYERAVRDTAGQLIARRRVTADAVVVAATAATAGRLIVVTAAERRLARAFLDEVGLGDAKLLASEVECDAKSVHECP